MGTLGDLGVRPIYPQKIAEFSSLSIKEIDDIMIRLVDKHYLDRINLKIDFKPLEKLLLGMKVEKKEEVNLVEIFEDAIGRTMSTMDIEYINQFKRTGYDDEMIADLKPYLLEGTIDADEMKEKNLVILKTLVDGQGNYDGIDILAGDEIQLKTVKNLSVPEEALKFLGEEEWYQQETLKVSAVVSRPLAKVETFIGDDGETAVDIIMTKEQIEKNFVISDDKTFSISVDKNADTSQISKKLREITADVNLCIV